MRPSQPCETAAKTSIGRSHHGRPREIRRRRRAGSFHTGGKPARQIAPQADNWSAQERSMQRRSECERPLRPMHGHVNHVCGLHNLWRKTLRSGKRGVMPLHAGWGEAGVLRRRLNIWSGKRDLNPRPSPWQGDALPLSYSRAITVGQRSGILLMQERSCQAINPPRPHLIFVVFSPLLSLPRLGNATKK